MHRILHEGQAELSKCRPDQSHRQPLISLLPKCKKLSSICIAWIVYHVYGIGVCGYEGTKGLDEVPILFHFRLSVVFHYYGVVYNTIVHAHISGAEEMHCLPKGICDNAAYYVPHSTTALVFRAGNIPLQQ